MQGLLDGRRGRRGPLKLTPEIAEFIAGAGPEVVHVARRLVLAASTRCGVRRANLHGRQHLLRSQPQMRPADDCGTPRTCGRRQADGLLNTLVRVLGDAHGPP